MAFSRQSILFLGAASGVIVGLGALATAPASAGSPPAGTYAAGGCTATAHVDSQWGTGASGGQILSVKVVNTSAATTTKWTATWPLGAGQRIVSAWNATVSAAAGTVTAANADYNGTLAAGASTTFGLYLAGVASVPALGCDNGITPPTTSPPPGGSDVAVTQADNLGTVTLVAGQTLGVSLPAEFLPPTVRGSALTAVSASGGYPSGDPVTALYRAAGAGSVDITARSDNACLHTTPPCTVPVMLWTLHVNVVAADGHTVVVTAADNLKTVRLSIGDTLVVSLAWNYLPPKLSTPGVLVEREVTGGYPTGQPLTARYVATAAGTVEVSTKTDIACNHEPTPCPSPTVPWKVTAVVTG
ncbi:hypothetical protein GCM10010172_79580 [Paractinoplanes ferrugineus]|uniref:CBM2 domain-containing protein n=1 Tax=Paractinoplanes ferrugineus TaxID=113564 RepID=A0A919J445_9ACTN|nr:cellulose binding domain-containing protein [Actinoplanes ferrugineus]GIE13032.1 hypothetical protein Afe05nite_48720 [Actinoplanes ferrugineus]